jgi:hypothetical protein
LLMSAFHSPPWLKLISNEALPQTDEACILSIT